MRALSIAEDEDDDVPPPPPPPKRKRASGRGKSRRVKRARAPETFAGRWFESMTASFRRSFKWLLLIALFFAATVVTGLFSGGHVAAAWRQVGEGFDSLMASAGLTVQNVTLDGRSETARADIVRMLGIKQGALMLYFDVDEARARLEALPWVKSAEVKRVWPDRIHIKIVERRAAAIWQHDGDLSVIDRDGHAIAGQDVSRFTSLPLVVGTGAEKAAGGLFDLLARQPDLKDRVKAAVRVGDRRWNLRLDNGVEVRLPEEGAEAALAELVRLAREQDILSRDIKAIDLRIPDRLIVKLPQASPLNPPAQKPSGGRDT